MEVIMTVPRNPLAKIADLEQAQSKVALWKQQGKQVVFTNGCFDILHPGHARYLYQARSSGDALVVGLNNDASVRRLKGPLRPILAEQERAELLAAMECVDLVVFFGEDTPEALIRTLLPDMLVKGADWALDKIVGREIVEAAGGRVVTLPLVEGVSTTQVVERILERYPKP